MIYFIVSIILNCTHISNLILVFSNLNLWYSRVSSKCNMPQFRLILKGTRQWFTVGCSATLPAKYQTKDLQIADQWSLSYATSMERLCFQMNNHSSNYWFTTKETGLYHASSSYFGSPTSGYLQYFFYHRFLEQHATKHSFAQYFYTVSKITTSPSRKEPG